jgi:calcium-dependent protein kinase
LFWRPHATAAAAAGGAGGGGSSSSSFAAAAAQQPPQQQQHDARADAIAQRSVGLREFGFAADFADRFDLGPMLGSGSFATVHLATERSTGRRFAVKTLPKRFAPDGATLDPPFAARVLREVDVYRTLGRSLNVAHLEGTYEDGVAVDLVLELCTGGTMWDRIRRGAYDERNAARLVREVLRAVAQAHSAGIAVRDVKPDNFLFLHEGADAPLKMVDFGLAQFCRDDEVLTDRCAVRCGGV